MNHILVLGTGELGHAIIASISQHSSFSSQTHTLTTTIRPSTLSSGLSSTRGAQLDKYKARNISILPLDIEVDTVDTLTRHFEPFTTIIHAGGMTLSSGTQMKVTQAVLASATTITTTTTTTTVGPESRTVKLYVPWQFGLDYDAIGPHAGGGLFAEQCAVRDLLRGQSQIDWVIVSNGIFTSFMFEPLWGVLEPVAETSSAADSSGGGGGEQPDKGTIEKLIVRALGSWEDSLVVTTAEDIARCTAELVLVDVHIRNKPVFIAGDSISYGRVADVIQKISGCQIQKEVWTTEFLEQKMLLEPENKLRKYHVVFSSGIGTNWSMTSSYNAGKKFKMMSVEDWLNQRLT